MSNPGPATGSSSSSAPAPAVPAANVQEFVIRVPKTTKKKHHVMRFNATLNVDFAQWRNVKMERDTALQANRQMEEEIPKFGAGSEYNREMKEELRRKRFGINPKKFKPEAQPWILKTGKNGKKFRGIREGGVGENAAFYVFTHAPDKAIEAYPLHEWYNFQPIQRYKSLSAEEAELEFGRRKKVINYFSLMLRKRLKGDDGEDGAEDAGDEKKPGKGKAKELKISDMDEWIDSDDDDSSVSSKEDKAAKDSDHEEESKKKKGKKEDAAKSKKKKRDVDGEAFEESDDGDEEGRELDYISDSSEDVSDLEVKVDKEMKGVAEEDALRKLLTSDEDSDDSREKSNEEEEKEEEAAAKEKELRDKEKKKKKTKKPTRDKKDSSSDFSTDSDSDDMEKEEKKKGKKKDAASSLAASTAPESSSALKRKGQGNSLPSDLTTPDSSNSPISTPAKKPKLEAPTLPASFAGVVSATSKEDYGITEEAVRRYLLRKPMTTTELLTKFKNKKTGVSSEKLVDTMTQILKRINPARQTIMGKMYLSIKVDK